MKLNQLADNQGSKQNTKRLGRGIGSGKGKTSGRGVKGQGARKSGNVRAGFEGGQNPLYRRLPMRGFNNVNFATDYHVVNVGLLQLLVDQNKIDPKSEISIDSIIALGITKKAKSGLKILGTGELKAKLTITAAAASASALEKVKKAGGSLNLIAKKEPVKKLTKKA